MMKFLYIFFALFLFACQGMPSKKPPIHLNPNMDDVERYDAQEKQYFYPGLGEDMKSRQRLNVAAISPILTASQVG